MRRMMLGIAAALALAVPSNSVSAQASARQGFYISLGLGWGTESDRCDGFASTGDCGPGGSGLSGYFAIGGTLSPSWRLGFESNGWTADIGNGVTQTVGMYSAAIAYYPSKTNDFWIKGNVASVRNALSGGGATDAVTGLALGAGLGFDFHPRNGKFALIPFMNYFYQLSGGGVSGGSGGTVRASLFQVGVGIGYRH